MKSIRTITFFLFIIGILSCSEEENYVPVEVVEEPQISPVVFDLDAVPYSTLSAYNFFEGAIIEQSPVYGVLPYDLITPLFSDYAKKKRFIWMPNDAKAVYTTDDAIVDFPSGSVIIKTFYYDNVLPNLTTQIIETRLIIKKNDAYIFANYKWNEDQTEAFLDNNGSFVNVSIEKDNNPFEINYRVPSETECRICHKSANESAIPIGPKPQNLNKLFNYTDGQKNQLQKWVDVGYLNNNIPSNINTVVNWEDEDESLELRARSYLDINCAHCHTDEAHCDYRPIRLSFSDTENAANSGICIAPEENINNALTHIISPRRNDRSVLWYRLNSIDGATMMPLISRSVKHDEGVALIEAWINSLETICE